MDNMKLRGSNFATTSSLLTATGAETVHDTTVLLNFCINGKAYTKSGTNADQATPTTDYSTSAAFVALTTSQGAVVVWAYNSSGTVKCMQGPAQALNADGTFKVAPQFPSVPDDVCPFAYQVLKAGATATTVTFGTSNWNATGFTNVIQNVLVLPDRPQIA